MYNILVCDDEKDIVSALKIYLEAEGCAVFTASNGREALELLRRETIHLVLLDVMMPELDGISALAVLREESNVPVILLTARSEDSDKVLGLNVGADDYVTKPFNPVELCARVRALLRRYLRLGGGRTEDDALTIGPIRLDDRAKEVTRDGETVALTPTEYEILRFLMRQQASMRNANVRFTWEQNSLTFPEKGVQCALVNKRVKARNKERKPSCPSQNCWKETQISTAMKSLW